MDMDTAQAMARCGILRREVHLRNPFTVEEQPFLSLLHAIAFKPRRRSSKRFIGKPAKRLFRLLFSLGMGGMGRFNLDLAGGRRSIAFNARNTQFGALYLPQCLPVYEPETSALLDLLVADSEVFVDVGANWGWYSLLVASRPGFAGRIHAFEPFPDTFRDLAGVVRDAGLDQIITCHDIALADTVGTSVMGFSDGIQSGLARLGEAGGVSIRLATMDSLDLPTPGVMKIDAEDHEIDVLRGAGATIGRARPFVVVENWLHRDRPSLTLDPFHWLSERDYCFFYAGWAIGDTDCIGPDLPDRPDSLRTLAVVPFLPGHRFHLPAQINVLAAPRERLDELRRRIEGRTTP